MPISLCSGTVQASIAHQLHCYWQAPRTDDPFKGGQAVAAAADDNDEDEDDSGGRSSFTKKELRQRCPL